MWSGQVRSYVRSYAQLKDRGVCSDLSINCDDGEAATFLAVCADTWVGSRWKAGALS